MAAATFQDFDQNRLLSVLSPDDHARLKPHFQVLEPAAGTVIQAAGENVTETWFPCGATLVCYCVETPEGQSTDVAMIGREGAIGGIVSHGNVPSFSTARVRFAGKLMRIQTAELERAKIDSIHLRHWFALYSDCLLAQVFQNSACNAAHTVSQRAARWLLAGVERTGSSDLRMTQEQLSEMLGVGRPFVNRVIASMRAEGVLETARGHVRIRDRAALLARTCNCSELTRQHYDTVLGGLYSE